MPDWARYYFGLGAQLAAFSNENRFVVALSLPARSYCSAFISLGFIVNREDLPLDVNHHKEMLRSQPEGTAVWFISERGGVRQKYQGILLGEKITDQGSFFHIRSDLITEQFVPFTKAGNISLRSTESISLAYTQKGRTLAAASPLAGYFFEPDKQKNLTQSRLDLVLVGPKGYLHYEICEELFYLGKTGETAALQEVLRVKEFQSGTQSFRSSVFSDRADSPLAAEIQDLPLVIFDGSQAFLKWRGYWPQSHWVVILDRTERQHNFATSQINNDYLARKADIGEVISFTGMPEGTQLMAYQAA